MKNTYGKLGIGLMAAVAAVGLVSAGPQTAQAQLELSAPVVTNDSTHSGVYDWTYTVTLNPPNETLTTGSFFDLSMASDSQLVADGTSGGYYSSTFLGTGGWSAIENSTSAPYYGQAKYTGGGLAVSGLYVGTFTIYSQTDHASLVGSSYFVVNSSNNVPQSVSAYTTTTGASGTDFTSLTYEQPINGSVNPSSFTQAAYIPSFSGTTVLSPLPLPAAFWPGLMTLGGMAVVGGLRLRRRSV